MASKRSHEKLRWQRLHERNQEREHRETEIASERYCMSRRENLREREKWQIKI